jgi:hypothetical protein
LAVSDSGNYAFVARNNASSATSQVAVLVVSPPPLPSITNGMVSYWPLNEVQGTKTPDLISGYDMELQNMTAADLVTGKYGKAFKFENSRQTMLERVHLDTDELPIYKHPNFSVSFWVNGASGLQDLRLFCESSTLNTTPMFSLGTPNTLTTSMTSLDIYIRTDSNTTAGHLYSVNPALDDTWHHVVFVQKEAGSTIQAVLYIDGVKDDMAIDSRRPITPNATAIGGIRRPTRNFWFTGMIDDVAVWKRALTAEEVAKLHVEGIPAVGAIAQPLAIRSFKSDFPAIAKGDNITLRWDVNKDATKVEIDQGVGDVTAGTVVGIGSVTIPLTESKTFTLKISRDTETVSAQINVSVIDGVANGWTLLDNFDRYTAWSQAVANWWGDLGANGAITNINGNPALDLRGTGRAVVLPLRDNTVVQGQKRTLFMRIYATGAASTAILSLAGLTDRGVRSYSDATDAGGLGPSAIPSNESNSELMVGARNGAGSTREFVPPVLQYNQVYNLWIDIQNDPIETGDIYTIYLQKEGDASRTELYSNYTCDRDPAGSPASTGQGATAPDLTTLFVANNAANAVLFDDFYLSKSGFNSTIPHAVGFTQPVGGKPISVSINRSATQLEIVWAEGTLESALSLAGPWSAVTGAASPSYKITPDGTQKFFRVKR